MDRNGIIRSCIALVVVSLSLVWSGCSSSEAAHENGAAQRQPDAQHTVKAQTADGKALAAPAPDSAGTEDRVVYLYRFDDLFGRIPPDTVHTTAVQDEDYIAPILFTVLGTSLFLYVFGWIFFSGMNVGG